jgi:uncharacterized membrane protein (DUF2068 family)
VIGVLKLMGGILFFAAVFGLFQLFRHDVHENLRHLVRLIKLDPDNHVIHTAISWVTGIDRKHLRLIEAGTFFYAALHTVEGLGLIFRQRWAGYLTVIATSSLLPVEAYEIWKGAHPAKIAVLVFNLAIVIYLVWRLWQEEREWRRLA